MTKYYGDFFNELKTLIKEDYNNIYEVFNITEDIKLIPNFEQKGSKGYIIKHIHKTDYYFILWGYNKATRIDAFPKLAYYPTHKDDFSIYRELLYRWMEDYSK